METGSAYGPTVLRYSYADVVSRIRAEVDKRKRAEPGWSVKRDILPLLGLKKWDWSKRMRADASGERGRGSTFTYEELSILCDYFKAAPGWPFIEWEYAEALNRLESLGRPRERIGEPTHPLEVAPSAQPGRRKGGGRR